MRKSSFAVFLLLGMFFAAGCGHKAKVNPPPAATTSGRPSQPPDRKAPTVAAPPVTPPPADTSRTPTLAPSLPDARGPIIRVKLTTPPEEIRISSTTEFAFAEKTPEAPRRTVAGPLQIRVERTQTEGPDIYRVQVASLATKAAGDRLGKELSETYSQPFVVREFPGRGLTQVCMGKFATRAEALAFASGPISERFRDAFVVQEPGDPIKGPATLALRGPDNLFQVSRAGFVLTPTQEGALLQVNRTNSYRGVLDISLGKDGSLVVVNQLYMEEYLMGVIPAELNPQSQEAALQAQAIAARTFALKRMPGSQGFDVTDDTTTQVYGGAGIEKQPSNDAVRKTAGLALFYNGELIEAMYMSTCGGHTEDYAEVFDRPAVPYLKGVFCTIEGAPAENGQRNLTGNHDLIRTITADDGTQANRELELAHVLGLTDIDRKAPDALTAAAEEAEIRSWIDRSRALAGRTDAEATRPQPAVARAAFLAYAAERIFGAREINRTVSEPDAAYYIANFSDGALVPASARRALAYLAQRKLWQPYPDNSVRPDQPVRRCDALTTLVRWILSLRPEVLNTAVAALPEGRSVNETSMLKVRKGNRTDSIRLAADFRLYKIASGRSLPVDILRIIGNEKLTYHVGAGGEVDFLEVELSASGAASDRFSPVASWQATLTRANAAEKLKTLAPNIGEIRDLRPARFGDSGRVVQLELVGSRGSAVVNGYQARNKLGLKDTLYTLSRTRADDGSVISFTFDGRGWGHGVGLCQTGAVGMAQAGRTAEEILKTYYQGVELRKMY